MTAASVLVATVGHADEKPDAVTIERTSTGAIVDNVKVTANVPGGYIVAPATLKDGRSGVLYSATESAGRGAPILSAFASASSGVTLSWNPDQEATRFTVSRDDKLLKSGISGYTFEDKSAVPGANYRYTVTVSTTRIFEVPEGGIPFPSSSTLTQPGERGSPSRDDGSKTGAKRQANIDAAKDALRAEAQPRTLVMMLPVDVPNGSDRASIASTISKRTGDRATERLDTGSNYADRGTGWNYRTTVDFQSFIEQPVALAFPCTIEGFYFTGDNRIFANPYTTTSGLRYRAMQQASVEWTNGVVLPGGFYAGAWTKPTQVYGQNGEVNETRTASTEYMGVELNSQDVNFVQFFMTHAASDPFCDTGGPMAQGILTGIQFYVAAPPSGSVSFVGQGRQSPHQQMGSFVSNPDGSSLQPWYLLWADTSLSFTCLVAGACENRSIE